ncbi:MAG: aminomethyl-transferring glycine dehydrogenase [Candidatus Nanopelagicales bacterium]
MTESKIRAFQDRHIGPSENEIQQMLEYLGYNSLDDFLGESIPESIRHFDDLVLPPALSEAAALSEIKSLALKNKQVKNFIGLGYYNSHLPNVIKRNILENPAWYTAYTPYQPEISQGRLEALVLFQTMISDLTGLDISNASLLDEPTAAAEAMRLAQRATGDDKDLFLVDRDIHPQTLAVLKTRAMPIGIEIKLINAMKDELDPSAFGVLVSYPTSTGGVKNYQDLTVKAHELGMKVIATTDLLALTLLTSPGEWGADIAVGSAQRFGVPFGFGGPHAGFMSVKDELSRMLPGRLVGASVDSAGRLAYRLALQTREQHIRRGKATSNICTSQVLLAVISTAYAVYHGPTGLKAIAKTVNAQANEFAQALKQNSQLTMHEVFFDTVAWQVDQAEALVKRLENQDINIRLVNPEWVAVSFDETTSDNLDDLYQALGLQRNEQSSISPDFGPLDRKSEYLTHPHFNKYHNETAMMRWLRSLSDKDIALDRSMIPLGSCTMKLNAAAEMEPITYPEFANAHPFSKTEQNEGWVTLIKQLEEYICSITGYDAVSLQPNAGSQGEFSGLLAIKAFHEANGDHERTICLIPSSAHGTNAASAVMAGMEVVVVECDEKGDVDLADLSAKIEKYSSELAAIMVTYPSTHGVYEEGIVKICQSVHEAGGQVYVDGANLNALVALSKPGKFGADVSHLNLHKTFSIPHGGGGPGVGPVAVRAHLSKFLPSHPLNENAGPKDPVVGPVSGAPWGSAGVLPISWMYIRMMGAEGLKQATSVALLSANFLAKKLDEHFPVLYKGKNGRVAHECIIDVREITKNTGVTVDDVAKRLMDFGFHAPTMSFPVAGTLMIEPTESEDLNEINRFIRAMSQIRKEISAIEKGEMSHEESPLANAPHTAQDIAGDWNRKYSREQAVFPLPEVVSRKYWPGVNRIDGAYGDRNLVCACPDIRDMAMAES